MRVGSVRRVRSPCTETITPLSASTPASGLTAGSSLNCVSPSPCSRRQHRQSPCHCASASLPSMHTTGERSRSSRSSRWYRSERTNQIELPVSTRTIPSGRNSTSTYSSKGSERIEERRGGLRAVPGPDLPRPGGAVGRDAPRPHRGREPQRQRGCPLRADAFPRLGPSALSGCVASRETHSIDQRPL